MTYPVAPQALVLAWGNELSLATNPATDRRNGGTELRGDNFQINLTTFTQTVQVMIVSATNKITIDSFFRNLKATPFSMSGSLWIVVNWSWMFKGGSGAGAVFQLSTSLKQVYRPGN